MAKVIRAGNMFFEDDIKIIDAELDLALNIPTNALPIFTRDEPQVLYNGHRFILTEKPSKDALFKVYTLTFGLNEADTVKKQEEEYFLTNKTEIDKIKEGFVERVINGVSGIDPLNTRMPQIGQDLAERLVKRYETLVKPQKQTPVDGGLIAKLQDDSVFNSEMNGCERVLLLDGKIYEMFTLPEYITIFQNSFEPEFYKKLHQASKTSTPEEVSKMISDNKDKVHRKVLPKVRNNVWHSERSAKIYLDNTYWIPQYRSSILDSLTLYQKLLEKKVKIDAARSLK